YSTVHSFYRRARISGLWDKIPEHLVQKTRTNAGRKESPSYAIIDSQSVKTVAASEERGIDGEKTKVRKRHIVVDVLGCLLSVVVHAANIHDTKGGISTARRAYERYPSIQKFCADAGYRGTFVSDLKEKLDLDVDISEKIKPHQWEILPWRWVVERTLSWLDHSRRLSKDYEISVSSAETMVKISNLHTLLKRL
ncbi:MAG: IS5 family transposase, partial [Oscillospiraceae bacterium]|nr:IS5 family transposase [Oscillospiraceae bacterium]